MKNKSPPIFVGHSLFNIDIILLSKKQITFSDLSVARYHINFIKPRHIQRDETFGACIQIEKQSRIFMDCLCSNHDAVNSFGKHRILRQDAKELLTQ